MPHSSVTVQALVIDNVPSGIAEILVDLAIRYQVSIVITPQDADVVDLP